MSTEDTSVIDCKNDGGVSRAKEIAIESALRLVEAAARVDVPQGNSSLLPTNLFVTDSNNRFVALAEHIYQWLIKTEPTNAS